ncbi:MAG TPA: DbpA RNA binding domain-containing protein [Longimicrobiaceae bacterium]|nr:DbpA RNA binding domain-containing protein [Longimicrobiaceae bacterium]
MASFDDLGLRAELLRVLEDEDLERPTALQEAVIPALRRGGNLVARASTGAGKTLAYGLGVLDALPQREAEEGAAPLRMLVLVPTLEEAERVAGALFPYVQAVGLAVTVPGGAWGLPLDQAEVVVSPVADAMQAVRGSSLKLDALEAVVVDGAAAIAKLGEWERVDTLLDLIPRDAQRVVVSASFPAEVEDLIDRRVKRALRYPAEAALAEEREQPTEGEIGFVVVPEHEKLDVLVRQLTGKEEGSLPPVIFARDDERAAELAEALSTRGYVVGSADDVEADVAVATADATREEMMEETGEETGQTLSFDVPADAATLLARHSGDAAAVVMVTPRELAHLKETARMARLRPRALPLPVERSAAAAELASFRSELRRAMREEDLGAQLLVLDPLFQEFSAPEIAAALAALVRRPAAPSPAAEAPAQQQPAVPAARASAEPGPAPATWARLYVGVGSRDDIRPGDLVGALAGEANIKGSQVGKIEIRDNFSIVEVESAVADRVIQMVNGTTIKGRSARVDYDRGQTRRPTERRQNNRPGGGPPRGEGPGGKRRLVRRPKE